MTASAALLLPLALLLPSATAELVFVAALWRHGDRAPSRLPYPNDANNETAWPRGWNQLTNEGMQQTFALGEWLKDRYMSGKPPHIKSVFNKDEVYVRSTDSERAITSAQTVMAGLFYPPSELVWKTSFMWQPTPIHTNGEGDDPLLKPTSIKCPKYKDVAQGENNDLLQTLDKSYESMYKTLQENSGLAQVNSSNADDFYNIVREKLHKLPQPEWVTDDLVAKITEYKRLVRVAEFNSAQKSRFRGGYLLGDWLRRINAAATGAKGAMRTVLYSAHDGTVSAIMHAMQVANDQLIPYAACFIAELHRTGDKHTIKLFYKNDTTSTAAVPLTVPSCATDCPLEEFNKIYSPIAIQTTEELEQICSLSASTSLMAMILLAFFLSNN